MIIGLTGGIGSGKTQVSDHFATLGITIVDTDVIARQVVAPNSNGLKAIIAHFGDAVIGADGSLNRAELRKRVFADEQQRQWLNQLTHPLIRTEMLHQCQQSTSPYTIVVVPLLLEGDMHQLVDRILVVDVDEQTQINRVRQRDNNNLNLIKQIIATQVDRTTRLARADDIIDNSGNLAQLHQQVEQLHQRYLTLAEA